MLKGYIIGMGNTEARQTIPTGTIPLIRIIKWSAVMNVITHGRSQDAFARLTFKVELFRNTLFSPSWITNHMHAKSLIL